MTAPQSRGDLVQLVQSEKLKRKFNELNIVKNVSFDQESVYAQQLLISNDFLAKVALGNPNSLKASIYNVAAVGLSLSPASKHAYLVPRGGAICLDISYKGLKRIATDSGAIEWAKAELVYQNDVFKLNGINTPPDHEFNPFSSKEERGVFVGGYCVAKLTTGDYMVETMSAEEIYKIRAVSKAKSGPWVDWFDEMAKKTIIKRASKSWPETQNRERWDRAIQILNETEGNAYTFEQKEHYDYLLREGSALDFYLFREAVGDEAWSALFNSGEKGQKVKLKEQARQLESEGARVLHDTIIELQGLIESQDLEGVIEIIEDLGEGLHLAKERLSPEHQQALEQIIDGRAE